MVLAAFGGMAVTIAMIASAEIKFGWLGCLHVVITVISVGVWFSAASMVDKDDDNEQ